LQKKNLTDFNFKDIQYFSPNATDQARNNSIAPLAEKNYIKKTTQFDLGKHPLKNQNQEHKKSNIFANMEQNKGLKNIIVDG